MRNTTNEEVRKNYQDLASSIAGQEWVPEDVTRSLRRCSSADELPDNAIIYVVAELICSAYGYEQKRAIGLARDIVLGQMVRPSKKLSSLLAAYGIRV